MKITAAPGVVEGDSPAQPTGPAGLLSGGVVLLAPGESVTAVSGCMKEPARERGEEAVTRAAPSQESVRVVSYGAGVHVTHVLAHSCCLEGEVVTSVDRERGEVRVVQRLSGQPCRCLCSSEVKTSVGLERGRYVVTLIVEAPEQEPRVVYTREVVIGAE